MKRVCLTCLVFILSFTSFNLISTKEAFAATTISTSLTSGQTTSTTSRITHKWPKKLYYRADTNKGNVEVAIFKDGKHYKSFHQKPGTSSFAELTSGGAGQYSLRLYCGTSKNLKKDCKVTGTIYTN